LHLLDESFELSGSALPVATRAKNLTMKTLELFERAIFVRRRKQRAVCHRHDFVTTSFALRMT
jgi:hypothetical protein